jgi:hypothetical protein
MPRIISVFRSTTKPADVAEWEKHAEQAETDSAAAVRLLYHLLLQVRIVKLLLIWGFVILPLSAVTVGVVAMASGVLN